MCNFSAKPECLLKTLEKDIPLTMKNSKEQTGKDVLEITSTKLVVDFGYPETSQSDFADAMKHMKSVYDDIGAEIIILCSKVFLTTFLELIIQLFEAVKGGKAAEVKVLLEHKLGATMLLASGIISKISSGESVRRALSFKYVVAK